MNFGKHSASGTSQSMEAKQNHLQRLTECLEMEGFDPATYTFEAEDTK